MFSFSILTVESYSAAPAVARSASGIAGTNRFRRITPRQDKEKLAMELLMVAYRAIA